MNGDRRHGKVLRASAIAMAFGVGVALLVCRIRNGADVDCAGDPAPQGASAVSAAKQQPLSHQLPRSRKGNPLSFCRPGIRPAPSVGAAGMQPSPCGTNILYHPLRAIEYFSGSPCVAENMSGPDADGYLTRVRVLRTDFKYPFVRVEETLVEAPGLARYIVVRTLAMVADHIVVKCRDGVTPTQFKAAVASLGYRILRPLELPGLYLVAVGDPEPAAVPGGVESCAAQAGAVAYAEPDYIYHIGQITEPDDPGMDKLWGLHNTGQTGGTPDADIDAPEAWTYGVGSTSVVVGVIDSGIDYTHPDLASNMWMNPGETGLGAGGVDRASNGIDDDGNGYVDDVYGYDFVSNDPDPMDDHFHGTHCAGTIGAVGNNGFGVVGVCWNVRLMALKFLSGGGYGSGSDAVRALYYAARNGARLTSNSWGGGGSSLAMLDAIDLATQTGQVFVAAAGNSSSDNDIYPHFPSSYPRDSVIAVAATDHADELASFSCWGAESVDLAAPGVDIYSTFPVETTAAMANYGLPASFASISGTSMATPHVAGAVALLLAHMPNLTPQEIREYLLFRVDGVASLTGRIVTGGRLNVQSMIDTNWVGRPAELALTGVLADDAAEGNGNGYVEGGEIIRLYPSYANLGHQEGTSVTVVVSTTNAAVEILNDTVVIGVVHGLQTATATNAVRVRLPVGVGDGDIFDLTLLATFDGDRSITNDYPLVSTVYEPVAVDVYHHGMGGFLPDPVRDRLYMRSGQVELYTRILALDVSTKDCRTVLRANCAAPVHGMDISPDGAFLYVALADKRVQVFSLPEMRHVGFVGIPITPYGFVCADAGKFCTRDSGETLTWDDWLRQYDLTTGHLESLLPCGGNMFRRSPDATEVYVAEGGSIVSGGFGAVYVHDVTGGRALTFDRIYSIYQLLTTDFCVDTEYDRAYATCWWMPWLQVNQSEHYLEFWEVERDVDGLGLHGVHFFPGSKFLYVRSWHGKVRKFLRKSGVAVADYAVDSWPGASLRVTRNGKVACVSRVASDNPKMVLVGADSLELETYPAARFEVRQTGAGAFEFDASPSDNPAGGALAYEWNFGDGSFSNGVTAVHEYGAFGTYAVTLSVINEAGVVDRLTREYLATNNVPPVAMDDEVSTGCGEAVVVDVLANDYDGDDGPDPLSVLSYSSPAAGTIYRFGDALRYVPDPGFVGVDTFDYEVTDGLALPAGATVTVNVTDNTAHADLSHAGLTGSGGRELLDGTWEMRGGYQYMVVTGDFDAVVQLVDYEVFTYGIGGYDARAGLRVEELEPNDNFRHYNAQSYPAWTDAGASNASCEHVKLSWKIFAVQGLGSIASDDLYCTPNVWMRMQRVGDVIASYTSPDGTDWSLQQMVTEQSRDEALKVGITSENGSGQVLHNRAIYDSFSVTPILGASTCAVPSIVPVGGTFETEVMVTLSCAETNVDIYYTVDGSTPVSMPYSVASWDPVTASHHYTTPFLLRADTTIKVRTFEPGRYPSSVTTAAFTVTPPPIAPTISDHPDSMTVYAGADAVLAVSASGTPTPVYQWYLGDTRIQGATNAVLSISRVRYVDGGEYKVLVSNAAGSLWSQAALLTVSDWGVPAPDTGTAAGSSAEGSADGAGTNATFFSPGDTALNVSNYLYIADTSNHLLRLLSPFGTVTTIAGGGTPGYADGVGSNALFSAPCGVAVDVSNNVYVADTGNHCIRVVTTGGDVSTLAGTNIAGFVDGTGTVARFNAPRGIAVGASNKIYVADTGNHCIRVIGPDGTVATFAGTNEVGFADGTGTVARFHSPCGIAIDAGGTVYVADRDNNRVRTVSPYASVLTVAGQSAAGCADGVGSNALFDSPCGVDVHWRGTVVVADSGNHRIREIDSGGNVSTVAGDGTAGFADGPSGVTRFNSPGGLSVDTTGDIYIADRGNHRIRTIWTPLVMEWCEVEQAGNAADPATGYGAVEDPYRVGRYEVTCAEYVKLLNAVARVSDPHKLYYYYDSGGSVSTMAGKARCGVVRIGASGNYYYYTKPDMANKPVNTVSQASAMRMANWMHNGQPRGVQDTTTTESGAYDLSTRYRRNGCAVFLPSENQWYKAAYYQPASAGGDTNNYWTYPTRTNADPATATATAVGDIANPGANVANYDNQCGWNGRTGNVTTVGSAGTASASYFGTFDQAGNVMEWTDTRQGSDPVIRGGSYADSDVSSSKRGSVLYETTVEQYGFRLACVPYVSGPASNVTQVSREDAYVRDGIFSDTNFGSAATLHVSAEGTGSNRNAYIKFDLSAITNTVLSASLDLYCQSVSSVVTVKVFSADNDEWREDHVTWSNRPGTANELGTIVVDTGGTNYVVDVTAFVSNTVAFDNVATFCLEAEPGDAPDCVFTSFEGGAHGPALDITRAVGSSAGVNLRPVCTASLDRVWGFAPLTVQCASQGADSDGYIAEYEWDFGDGTVLSAQNAEHTFMHPGAYSVRVTVVDDKGARDGFVIEVDVMSRSGDGFIRIGDPGNGGEQSRLSQFGDTNYYGAVGYAYEIAKYEMTCGEFVEYLNSAAKRDVSRKLWNSGVFNFATKQGEGTAGDPYVWSVKPESRLSVADRITWLEAARYVNWLHNGRPDVPAAVAGLLSGVTEDGAYDMSLAAVDVVRRPNAIWVLPTEDEWYKSAHYRPATKDYADGTASGPGPWGVMAQANGTDEWTETLHDSSQRRTRDDTRRWAAGWYSMTSPRDNLGVRVARMVDTDGDGLTDRDEVVLYRTDPERADTDGDGFSDSNEIAVGSDPLDPSFYPGPPQITSQPRNCVATVGGHAAFEVEVRAAPLPQYQWHYHNMKVWAGDQARLDIPSVGDDHVSFYHVVVSNEYGAVTSASAYLTMNAITVPGVIEAEDYKAGGEGIAYHDTTPGNSGAVYRADDVDIGELSTPLDVDEGGYFVGWLEAGEWLAYDISLEETGAYDIFVRVASGVPGTKTLRLTWDGDTLADPVSFTNAAGDQKWEDVLLSHVMLTGGVHELRMAMDTGGFQVDRLLVEPFAGLPASTPEFGPDGGTISSPVLVVISCTNAGSVIYYTTDGSIPDVSSTSGSSGMSLLIDRPTSLRAVATAAGYRSSAVKSAFYAMLDSDWDGMPDWWEELYFGGSTNGVADGDGDGDGMSNIREWRAGTHPGDEASRLAVVAMDASFAATNTIVVRWLSASNRTYRLNATTNLAVGFSPQAQGIAATPPQNCMTVQVDSAVGFYEVEVEE